MGRTTNKGGCRMNQWFNVDKEGLAKVLERRGRGFALLELLQNGWDTNATRVEMTLTPQPGKAEVRVEIRDDCPTGFKNLEHAYTLFAESCRKGDSTKRGRFNLGEKLVLALCREATISSTTGSVVFSHDGTRRRRKAGATATGSSFVGYMAMTREQLAEALTIVRSVIPPPGVVTVLDVSARATELQTAPRGAT